VGRQEQPYQSNIERGLGHPKWAGQTNIGTDRRGGRWISGVCGARNRRLVKKSVSETTMRISRKIPLGAFLLAISAALALVSHGYADTDRRITGSWFGVATATTAPLPPVKDLITFSGDGTVVETQRLYLRNTPLGPLMRTPGHGAWVQVGDREFALTLIIIYQGAPDHPTTPGEVVALETVHIRVTLVDSNKLSGSIEDEIDDLSGHAVFVGPGTYEATRIVART
jgi:hypothetical protein